MSPNEHETRAAKQRENLFRGFILTLREEKTFVVSRGKYLAVCHALELCLWNLAPEFATIGTCMNLKQYINQKAGFGGMGTNVNGIAFILYN